MMTRAGRPLKTTLLILSFVFVVLSGNVRRQTNLFGRPSFRSLLDIKDEGTAVEDDDECRVGGNFCQNGGTCSKLKPDDVRGLSSSNEMIYRLQLAALSSTETERQRILGFRCTCTSGFKGEFCQTRTLDLSSMMHPPVWLICVIVAIVVCLVALIVAILFYRSRSKSKTDGIDTSTGDLEKAVEDEEEKQDEDEALRPDGSAYDMATPQLSPHSQLLSSVVMGEKTARTSSPFDPDDEALLAVNGVSTQVDSSSTLISDKPVSEKSYTPDASMLPDEVWENDPNFQVPFLTRSILRTSNRASARASGDEDNANPLGMGRAYSFVDDSYVTNDSWSPMHDTAAQDTYQGQLNRDENGANYSEPHSQVSLDVQSVEIVDQVEEDYAEYYNRGSSEATEISEELQNSYRNIRQTQSLDHHPKSHVRFQRTDDSSLQLRQNDPSPQMTERSESHGLKRRPESFYQNDRAAEKPSSFAVHDDSDSYEVIYSAETPNDPQLIRSDLYTDQSAENPNMQQRNFDSPEIDEIENRQRNKHRVKPAEYSDISRFYKNNALEETEKDELPRHHTLSTILETGYSDEYIRATNSYEKPKLFNNDSAQQLAEMEGDNECVENEQLYESTEVRENSHSNENVEQIQQQTKTFQTHPTPPRKSSWPACLDTPHLDPAEVQSSSSRLTALIRSEFKPRKSMSYSSVSNQSKINRSSNSNSFREQLELLQKDWSPVASAESDQFVVSGSVETFPSLIEINASSSQNQNRSNQNLSGPSLSEVGNGDRDHPFSGDRDHPFSGDRDHLSSDEVKPTDVKCVLPKVARQAKKGEKDKRKGNRNKHNSRSNPWSLLSGKPMMEDKKKKASSSRKVMNLCTEKPQLHKQNPNDFLYNATHEIDNSVGRVVDNDINKKTVQQQHELQVTTCEDESAGNEMTDNNNKSEFLLTGYEDENDLQSMQIGLEDACCDQTQSGQEHTNEKIFENALPERQQLLEQYQRDHQFMDRIEQDQQLPVQTRHKMESRLERLHDEGEQLERTQEEKQLKERAQEEQQLKERTQEEQQQKERTQEEQLLLSKSLQLLDKRREKQKSVVAERLERLRIEKAHREHQLREKERKEQLRIKNSKQLLPQGASGKEQQSWFERTSQEELQLENKKQELRRFESAKKECRPGFMNTQAVHKRLKNAKDNLQITKNVRHEKTQQQKQQKLLEKVAEEVLRVENARVAQVGGSRESPEQRHRFESAQRPLVCLKLSEITQQSPEQIASAEKLPEKATEFKGERMERPHLRNSLSEPLMLEISQKKLSSSENGPKRQWQFDHFQKEALRIKNGQRKRLQLDRLQAEAPSTQKEHQRFDISQQKDIWLATEQKERSMFDNNLGLQKRDPSPQNGQREHLRFENVRKKFPWPDNNTEKEDLQADNLQTRDLALKSEQKQLQRSRFENLQKAFRPICPTNDQRDQIPFDVSHRQEVDTFHQEEVDTFHREGVDTSHGGVDTSLVERVDTSHGEEVNLENAQTDEQRSKMTLMQLISQSLMRSGEEEMENRRIEEIRGGVGGQKRFLWTSRSSLSIRLPRDSSSSCSQRRSYSDVALALKDSLENVNNACSSIFKHGDRFNLDDEEEESSEWDTLTERTADEKSDPEFVPSSSSISSSGMVSLKVIACETVVSCPATREVDGEKENRLNERPVSTAKKVWKSSKGSELLCSSKLPDAVMNELKLYLTHYRQRVAASSEEV